MGVIGRFMWMNTCSKKQCRSLFWRIRAAMRKAVKKQTSLVAFYGGPKKQFNFQYDPSSYALNFDDGTYHHHDHHHHNGVEHHKITKLPLAKQQECQESYSSSTATIIWVNVIWVGSF